MKLIISPAKSLDYETPVPTSICTVPLFLSESKKISKVLKKQTPKQLSDLMAISDNLAQLNWERNQKWQVPYPENEARQAIYAFNGEVYIGLDAYSITPEKLDVLQNTVMILSGLYGLLKPLDLILPYRLEMGTKLAVGTSKNLYEFWKEGLTKKINATCQKDDILVNLASKEYASVLDFKKIKAEVITPEFKDYKNGELKMISFFAKKARGLMARFILDTNAKNINDLKAFNYEGYAFDGNLSKGNTLVFTR